MVFSEKYNFIFIASPKTGTVTVQKVLQNLDPEAERFKIKRGTEEIKIFGHARAIDIKEAIGDDFYNQHQTFAFVRNPLSKFVSSYFFYKGSSFKTKKQIKSLKWRVDRSLKVLFAKIFPFKIWAILYPYKSNYGHITDRKGNLIVDYIGRTENLNQDLIFILKKMDIPTDGIIIERLNTSKHKDYSSYYKGQWFKNFVEKKLAKDLELYNQLVEKMNKEED